MSQHYHPRVLRFSWLLGFYGIAMTKNPVNLVNPVFTQFPLRCGRARSDVFDGLAWRGVSEVKRTVAFCFRWSLAEEKQISLAAPHHRKVSAPRPPLSAHSRHHTTNTINSPQEYSAINSHDSLRCGPSSLRRFRWSRLARRF